MGTTTTAAISIDRFRRRRAAADAAAAADALGSVPAAHPLTGVALGTIERRYGLMSSEDTITIAEVIATSGDLAVADRLAFVAAMERHVAVAVVEVDGWYVACTTERAISPAEVANLRPNDDSPRVMSIASERGITPALGPLSA
ncbi:MAG: hypothetical protein KDC46_12265 [Thermoleophilia bacterium]|nr:hypothetical protein [Thermoleophilia bacterium]